MSLAIEGIATRYREYLQSRDGEMRRKFAPEQIELPDGYLNEAQQKRLRQDRELIGSVFAAVMEEFGISNFAIVEDFSQANDPLERGKSVGFVLKFIESADKLSWSEDFGYKAIRLHAHLTYHSSHTIVAKGITLPLSTFSARTYRVIGQLELRNALRLASKEDATEAIQANVYFNVANATDVKRSLEDLIRLALISPTRVSPKF